MEITQRKDRSQGHLNMPQIISPLKSERLTANIILILLKEVITDVMTYACPA
jgi:hypothetical protein